MDHLFFVDPAPFAFGDPHCTNHPGSQSFSFLPLLLGGGGYYAEGPGLRALLRFRFNASMSGPLF